MAAGAVHELLRTATREGHERLEAAMALDPATVTRERYARGLQVLHAARAAWEPEIEALLPGSAGPHLGWLEEDLAVLAAPVPAAAERLGLEDAGQAWGSRYVLEGSALGGRVLVRAMERLGFSAERGARYFAGHGAETGARWRSFLVGLEAAEPGAALVGARRTFGALCGMAEGR